MIMISPFIEGLSNKITILLILFKILTIESSWKTLKSKSI